MRFPRSRPLVEPVSSADAPFHRSGAFYVRVGALAAVAAVVLGVLALRLWSLQVIQGPRYAALAVQQSYRTVDLPGPRGAIVDARGRLLAGTNGRLVIVADRSSFGTLDDHGRWRANEDGLVQLSRLARVANVPLASLVQRMEEAVLRSPYAPAVVIPQPSRALADYLEERAEKFPGIHVEAMPIRSYPQGGAGAEFLGLLGEVSAQQLAKDVYPGAKAGQLVGQSGVEARYDRWLDGGFRRARLPVDSQGRILGPLRPSPNEKPLPTLHLTIDMRIQRAAEHAVEDGIALAHKNGHTDSAAGAAVVMDARNGALLALASVPTYNQLLAAHDPSYYERLLRQDSSTTPLLNRAIQGLYPTGSTFKPVVAEAALRTGLITPGSSLLCSGAFTIGGFTFHNVEPGIYSYMSLPTALAQSCDTWFYRLGDLLYTNGRALAIQQQAHLFGLGHPTGLDVPGEYGGVVPTPSWLEKTYKEQWYEGQTINLSIGQGYLAVTPLQLAVAYAALANGGTVVRPHVAEAIGHHVLRFKPVRHLKLPDLWAIHDGLFEAAHSAIGTSSAIFGSYQPAVAGKTGTAETGHGSDHSWYASWAPAGNPRYVVVVLIEHGGFGAEAAAPAAKEIYDALFHPRR